MSILLNEQTPIMIQGITGEEASIHVAYMQKYGTNIVCGVSPGRGGSMVSGVPVYNTVEEAVAHHQVTWSVLFLGAKNVKPAAIEAIKAGVPGLVILEDGVPFHDTAEILALARASNTRIIGPSSQGMISPGKAKLGASGGATPERVFRQGRVGVISRSGGMGVEICLLLTRFGIGQSTYVAIGGDLMVGTGFADLFVDFEQDPDTDAIVIFGEPGTEHEEIAAEALQNKVTTKPVIALLVGTCLAGMTQGLTFGHTAAIMGNGRGSTEAKTLALRDAGAIVTHELATLPSLLAETIGMKTS